MDLFQPFLGGTKAFIIGKAYGTMSAEWPTLLAQSFLLQAWVPHFTENALQMHCWFLSRWAAEANLDDFCLVDVVFFPSGRRCGEQQVVKLKRITSKYIADIHMY